MITGDYRIIADVGASVVKLLQQEMTPDPIARPELIGMASPVDTGDLQLSLYLYNIVEDGDARVNQMISLGTDKLKYPPMTIELKYLLTAHSTAELHSRALDEHRILGRAMQVLYDNANLRRDAMQGTLAQSNEEVRIRYDSIRGDMLLGMWNFNDVPYKASVCYSVGPIFLDSMRTRPTKRVLEADFGVRDKEEGR